LERAVILSDGPVLEIDPEVLAVPPPPADPGAAGGTLQEAERGHILAALERANWVIEGPNGAARALGLHPNTLRSRLKRLGISRPADES
jgi:formate hydrogenlyase transcriptional activator